MKKTKSLLLFSGLFILSVILWGNTFAENQRGMVSEDLFNLREVSQIAISPDGENIAYTVSVPRDPFNEEDGSSYKWLYVYKNKKSYPYITGEVSISSIKFSPDGNFISYLSKRNDDKQKSLYKIPIDGGESQKIIEFTTEISEYEWSPSGNQIAFIAKDSTDTKSTEIKDKGFKQEVYEEGWQQRQIWLYDLKNKSYEKFDLDGSAYTLKWSPDGNYLSIALTPTPLVDDRYVSKRVTIVDVKSKSIKTQFKSEGKVGSIVWSPDSKSVAVISSADKNDPASGRLSIGKIDSENLEFVINEFEGHMKNILWVKSELIYFLADIGVGTSFGVFNPVTKNMKTMFERTDIIYRDFKYSIETNKFCFVANSPYHPNELFIVEQDVKKVTDNNPWLSNTKLAKQEVLKYKARDGLELEGLLIYPLNYKQGKKYPLIMSVHGGPEAHRRNGWLTWYSGPGQIAAAKDFVVFYPNYRGSTGRGVEFSKMGQADYAGGEFNDLVDAIDHLVEIGLVERSKVGITGRSYGGYASAWAATALTEHFAASVMGVGVSDLISKFGTTDIPIEMYDVHARRWPWDYWQWFLERSPIYYSQQANTPILIMHGKNDPRVHPSQSMELYRYLKTVGKAPVRLVLYPGEGHGSSKASSRYDYNLRMLRWMEHYLKGEGGDPPSYDIEYNSMTK